MNRDAFHHRCLRIYVIGCLCCRRRGWYAIPEVHHLNVGQHAGAYRRGDEYTIGLCVWHHQGKIPAAFRTERQCRRRLGPSLKHESKAFREEFGSDDELLAWQNELIEQAESNVVGRSA